MKRTNLTGQEETLYAVIGELGEIVCTFWNVTGTPLPVFEGQMIEAPDDTCDSSWTYDPVTQEFSPPA